MEKALFKYNSGHGALLCSGCRKILKTGHEFNEDELAGIKGHAIVPPQYCKKCQLVRTLNENDIEWSESMKSLDDLKYKVISFHPPIPTEAIDIITTKDVISRGGMGPNDDKMVIDIYFPM